VVLPGGDGGGQLHRVVRLDRRRVRVLDLDRGGVGQRLVRVAALVLQLLAKRLLRFRGRAAGRVALQQRLLLGVGHLHQLGAAAASISFTLPLATVPATRAAWATPFAATSAAYFAAPVTFSLPSTRSRGVPTAFLLMPSLPRWSGRGRRCAAPARS